MKYLRLFPLLLLAACDGDAPSEPLPVVWADAAATYVAAGVTALTFSGSSTYASIAFIGRSRLARTTNAGQSWTTLDSTTSTGSTFYDVAADGNTILVGDGRLVRRSNDGGRTWTTQPLEPVQDAYEVSLSPLLVIGNSHLYRFDQTTGTWRSTGETAYHDHVLSDALHVGSRLLAAVGPLYTSDDGGATWVSRTDSARFGSLAADEDGTLYAASDRPDPSARLGLYRSTDRGTTWELFALRGQPLSSVAAFGRSIFVGGAGVVWRSTNGGETWTDVTGKLAAQLTDGYPVRVLELAPDGHVWVGTRYGLWRTTEPVAR